MAWLEWPDAHKYTDAKARRALSRSFADETGYYKFIQFIFFKQWNELKQYAHENGIRIIGDIPIFVSPDSADVWADQQLFQLNEKATPWQLPVFRPTIFLPQASCGAIRSMTGKRTKPPAMPGGLSASKTS